MQATYNVTLNKPTIFVCSWGLSIASTTFFYCSFEKKIVKNLFGDVDSCLCVCGIAAMYGKLNVQLNPSNLFINISIRLIIIRKLA